MNIIVPFVSFPQASEREFEGHRFVSRETVMCYPRSSWFGFFGLVLEFYYIGIGQFQVQVQVKKKNGHPKKKKFISILGFS